MKRVVRAMATTTASRRVLETDTPCIVTMQAMLRGKAGVLSLAQGIVHWAPPPEALAAARASIDDPASCMYCADDGLPELRSALKEKLARENGLVASEVMVTAGANQVYNDVQQACSTNRPNCDGFPQEWHCFLPGPLCRVNTLTLTLMPTSPTGLTSQVTRLVGLQCGRS